jgi:hypothetical protein
LPQNESGGFELAPLSADQAEFAASHIKECDAAPYKVNHTFKGEPHVLSFNISMSYAFSRS